MTHHNESSPTVWQHLLLSLLLLLVTFGLFHDSRNVPFQFDDNEGIARNESIRQPGHIKALLLEGDPPRPVLNISYAANYALHELEPFGYHLVNLIGHALAGLLAYWLAFRLVQPGGTSGAVRATQTRAMGLAALAALVFLIHPVQTEAVSYIWGRSSLLAGLFSLAALVAYLEARLVASSAWRSISWRILAAVCFMMALGSKANAISLPLLLLLLEWLVLRRERPLGLLALAAWQWPFWLIAALRALPYLWGRDQVMLIVGLAFTAGLFFLARPAALPLAGRRGQRVSGLIVGLSGLIILAGIGKFADRPFLGLAAGLLAAAIGCLYFIAQRKLTPPGLSVGQWALLGASYLSYILTLITTPFAFFLPVGLLLADTMRIRLQGGAVSITDILRRHGVLWLIYTAMLCIIAARTWLFDSWPPSMPSLKPAPPLINLHPWPADLTLWSNLLTQTAAFAHYLKLLIAPLEQNVDHHLPLVLSLSDPRFWLGSVTLLIVSAGAWFSRQRQPLIALGLAWTIANLIFFFLIPLRDQLVERNLYLPVFGLALILVGSASLAMERLRGTAGTPVVAVVASLIILCFSILTLQRIQVWQTPLSLWADSTAKSPDKSRPFLNYAYVLARAGKTTEAVNAAMRSRANDENNAEAYFALIDTLMADYQMDEAMKLFRHALAEVPAQAAAWFIRLHGKRPELDLHLERNLTLFESQLGQHTKADTLAALGTIHIQTFKDRPRARDYFQQAHNQADELIHFRAEPLGRILRRLERILATEAPSQ